MVRTAANNDNSNQEKKNTSLTFVNFFNDPNVIGDSISETNINPL